MGECVRGGAIETAGFHGDARTLHYFILIPAAGQEKL